MRFRISLRGRRTVLPVLTDCFDSSQKTPQECAVIQCCYHSPDNQNFIFYRNTFASWNCLVRESHSWRRSFWGYGARFLHLEHVFGARVRHFPAVPRHFPTFPKMVARTSPLLSLGVYVCVRVHICVLENGKKWRRRIPPKKFKSEHAVVVAMLIIYFFKLFFYLPLFYL